MEAFRDSKLKYFTIEGVSLPVTYVETSDVTEGVSCDVYAFTEDDSKDLGVVQVAPGYATPLQRVVDGTLTVEGHIAGEGSLIVTNEVGDVTTYVYTSQMPAEPVTVNVGDTMQWQADDAGLIFYEICEPPYQDGRFEVINQ